MKNQARRLRLVVAWVAAAIVLAGAPAFGEGSAVKVGEFEPASISTLHPYVAGDRAHAAEWVITYPGATYIRVHFSRFDLAPGDTLVIENPAGTESYSYERLGPHGTGEFWAFAILGDTAVLRLDAPVGGGFGFEVDGFGQGIFDLGGLGGPGGDPQPESVCGTQDWRDVECYGSSYPTEYERSSGAVLALIGCCSACTGFKVSDSGQFLTNNHCTSTQNGVQSTELRMEYKLSGCSSGSSGYSGAVMGSQLLRTDYTLDYTLMTTTGNSGAIPCLELENRVPAVGERIYIAGHPNGGVKKLSIESDRNTGGLCRVDAAPYPGRDATSDVAYYCDTIGGSSGSPVLSGDTHKVVAIHHYGGCLNSGVRMDRILGQIGGQLDACTGGGGGSCGDGTCAGGETFCTCPADCPPVDEICNDGIDNDCDGAIDCADSWCGLDPACNVSCSPTGDLCRRNGDCCSGVCRGRGKAPKTCQ